ncbi:thioredoxin domain-containing protein [Hymenobacter properus]|uniref:Thioredoxin domain-containing protein n=1 Tax=Hymenobacter properus TaxID=2791026 RepID=A0A931BE63_9BACT|nr:thioredoxin domain-containing protein [Hymenobacter properus]MBF9142164.1 thioredoxin domain-containing protein [Hymenobacter properus]MBR7720971.1 thioredoxin domain-containing protein [Microvirga sp. SRT04]
MTHASFFSNRLAQETSPYLQQHAHNPVDWYPWGPEALNRAKAEQKPILVSIGYAACHWCHVMERESFENVAVAEVMNQHFVCIKVDREERPDVDQVYIEALHAMGLQGGWPLNVFLTSEAKPFYGGTYFSPGNWTKLLANIGEAYAGEHRAELEQSAERFMEVIGASELQKYGASNGHAAQEALGGTPETGPAGVSDDEFKLLVYNLSTQFDRERGGMNRAPKFPMPGIWRLLLRAYAISGSPAVLNQAVLTLREMAWGGIYDQVHGGFARYSVDAEWLAPHFEKMLYDNGQLVSLYSEAFQLTQDELFREVVYDTIEFVRLELTNAEGGFYSSLDADSEGEEGKFYVFTKDELRDILGDEEPLFSAYYNCTALGNWEHGRNILHRRQSDADFAAAHQLTAGIVPELMAGWKQKIMAVRATRVRPGLDDKVLTGWNALMLQGLTDAYRAFGEPEFLVMAEHNAAFIQKNLRNGAGLFRTCKNGRASINGFLEDFALVIQAYISLYEVSFGESWLREAEALTEYVLDNFFDPAETQFFYTDRRAEALIARKKELMDNVIPSSNSVMAHNLRRLGRHLENPRYTDLAANMLAQVRHLVVREAQHLANWASLYAALLRPGAEIAIIGPDAEDFRQELSRHFLFDAVLAGAEKSSELPLLKLLKAPEQGRTAIHICRNQACLAPVYSVAEARKLLAEF